MKLDDERARLAIIDPAAAVDAYLSAQYHVGLEAMLLDASTGLLPAALAGVVTVDLATVTTLYYRGGGSAKLLQGTATVQGVLYIAAYWVWTDIDGYRCVTDIKQFEPESWSTRLAIGAAG